MGNLQLAPSTIWRGFACKCWTSHWRSCADSEVWRPPPRNHGVCWGLPVWPKFAVYKQGLEGRNSGSRTHLAWGSWSNLPKFLCGSEWRFQHVGGGCLVPSDFVWFWGALLTAGRRTFKKVFSLADAALRSSHPAQIRVWRWVKIPTWESPAFATMLRSEGNRKVSTAKLRSWRHSHPDCVFLWPCILRRTRAQTLCPLKTQIITLRTVQCMPIDFSLSVFYAKQSSLFNMAVTDVVDWFLWFFSGAITLYVRGKRENCVGDACALPGCTCCPLWVGLCVRVCVWRGKIRPGQANATSCLQFRVALFWASLMPRGIHTKTDSHLEGFTPRTCLFLRSAPHRVTLQALGFWAVSEKHTVELQEGWHRSVRHQRRKGLSQIWKQIQKRWWPVPYRKSKNSPRTTGSRSRTCYMLPQVTSGTFRQRKPIEMEALCPVSLRQICATLPAILLCAFQRRPKNPKPADPLHWNCGSRLDFWQPMNLGMICCEVQDPLALVHYH